MRAARVQARQPVRCSARDTVWNTGTATRDSTCAFRGRHAHAYYIGRTSGAVGGRREGVEQLLLDGPQPGEVCCTLSDTLPAGGADAKSNQAGRNRCRLGHSRRRAATGGHARSTRDAGGGARLLVPLQVMEGLHSVGVA